MNSVEIQNQRWSLSGTLLFHAAIIITLFFVKCGNGGGGGGGNNGYGYEGLMGLDVAGFGDAENGFGEEYHEAVAEEYDQPTVQEEMPAITDDAAPEAPSVTNKPTTKPTTKPKDNTTKPTTTPKETKPAVSKDLNNALGGMKPSGQGSTSGSGQTGTQTGQIGKNGALGGGGSQGTGGGQGGGTGTGTGTGTGPGSGPGSGGNNMDYTLSGRVIKQRPSLSEQAPDEGTVRVKIWVNRDGVVTKVEIDQSGTNTGNTQLWDLAKKAAMKARFDANPGAVELQTGTITIKFRPT
jgi:TonB family protein